ncbi:matrix metalloproteinase-16-like [Rhopilema esculentum]|uniref:matrix metalloproteinase-16-like n=1 Tax=Rhopilema esculentum TaxID=499914 RepID=UPI0031D26E6A
MGIAKLVFLLLLGVSAMEVFGKPMQSGKTSAVVQKGGATQRVLCGNQKAAAQDKKRKRRFITRGIRWEKKTITWSLKNFTPHLNPLITLILTRRAFNEWEKYSALTFKEVSTGNADIEISFEPKKHFLYGSLYCDMEFDGPGGTVGHAFYPIKHAVYGGNIHLDVDEKFSADGRSGFNFGSTIMHEIGHSLGLLHSNHYYSIMHPEYAMKAEGDYIPLTVDDIEGIQSIYGPPDLKEKSKQEDEIMNTVEEESQPSQEKTQSMSKSVAQTTSTTVPSQDKPNNAVTENESKSSTDPISRKPVEFKKIIDGKKNKEKTVTNTGISVVDSRPAKAQKHEAWQSHSHNDSEHTDLESSSLDRSAKCPRTVDAMFVSKFDKQTYIFSGKYMYSIGNWLGYEGKNVYTRNRFIFETIDAVYRTIKEGKLILFSNRLYAVYKDDLVLERYGAIYELGFPYSINKVDAALTFGYYRNTYFFTGDTYWRYNEGTKKMDPGYPKKIRSAWKGVPSYVDAAITWKNGMTYFFKDKQYYRVDYYSVAVEPGYPKSIEKIWTECPSFERKRLLRAGPGH